jgi:hypothetical protein
MIGHHSFVRIRCIDSLVDSHDLQRSKTWLERRQVSQRKACSWHMKNRSFTMSEILQQALTITTDRQNLMPA